MNCATYLSGFYLEISIIHSNSMIHYFDVCNLVITLKRHQADAFPHHNSQPNIFKHFS